MNESYVEVLVKKKNKPVYTVIKLVMVILTAVLALAVVITGIWLLAIPAVLLLLADWFFLPGLVLEFEYLFVSGELTIDKIIGKTKRKNCVTVEMEKIECIAPEGSERLLDYRNMKLVEHDYSSGREEVQPYICIFHSEKALWKIKFEPDERMLELMRQTSPRKISMQ